MITLDNEERGGLCWRVDTLAAFARLRYPNSAGDCGTISALASTGKMPARLAISIAQYAGPSGMTLVGCAVSRLEIAGDSDMLTTIERAESLLRAWGVLRCAC